MIVEMRTYTLKPGTRDKVATAFPAVLAECKRIGMRAAGPWLSTENPNVLFWMRAFPDAAARAAMTDAFYSGAAWRNELADAFMPNLERYDVVPVEMDERAVTWAV
jgi:hypothetical protein